MLSISGALVTIITLFLVNGTQEAVLLFLGVATIVIGFLIVVRRQFVYREPLAADMIGGELRIPKGTYTSKSSDNEPVIHRILMKSGYWLILAVVSVYLRLLFMKFAISRIFSELPGTPGERTDNTNIFFAPDSRAQANDAK